MVHAVLKTKKWGNSIGMIVPREVASQVDLKPGEEVNADLVKKDRVDFFGKYKGIGHFVRDHNDHEF